MIRFFRQIRQSLIMPDNIRRYLLYALGEILLVVIGILIALQVNNWNEKRHNENSRRNYTQSLINDIAQDTTMLTYLSGRAKTDSLLIRSFEKRLKDSDFNYDTLQYILRYDFDPFVYRNFTMNSATLNTIISTGAIAYYPEELAKYLSELQRGYLNIEDLLTVSSEKYLDNLNADTHFPFENYLFDSGSKFRDDIWKNNSPIETAAYFERLADWKLAYNQIALNVSRSLIPQLRHLISVLKKLEELE